MRDFLLLSCIVSAALFLQASILRAQQQPISQIAVAKHDPARQAESFYTQRAGNSGIPKGAYLNALQQRMAMPIEPTIAALTPWVPLGPAPIPNGYNDTPTSGRVTAIAVDRTNPNIIYVGAAQGGVWKSSDGGGTWTPLTDRQPSLATGSITIDPSNPNVIYVGTGEANTSLRQGPCDIYYGAGVLKSTDGGATWTQLGASIFAGTTIHRIIVSPLDSNTLYLTASIGRTSSASAACDIAPLVNVGVFKSTNGGNTWAQILLTIPSDLVMDPSNPNILYAASWGDVPIFLTNFNSGIYKSTDGGTTWAPVGGILGLLANPGLRGSFGRVSLAIAPSSPSTIYVSLQDCSFSCTDELIFKSTDGGASWPVILVAPLVSIGLRQWPYSSLLATDPNDPNTFYVGDTDLYKFSNGVFTDLAGYDRCQRDPLTGLCGKNMVHVDMHALVFAPGDSRTFYLGTDGGIYKTIDGGSTDGGWTNLNTNLAITQFQSVATHPGTGQILIGGTQDNGTLLFDNFVGWKQIRGGDGGYTVIDPTPPNYSYYSTQTVMSLARSNDGGVNWTPISPSFPPDACPQFYPPMVMDTNNFGALATGGLFFWLTLNPLREDGTNWRPGFLPHAAGSCRIGSPDGDSKITAIGFGLSSFGSRFYVGREAGGGIATSTDGLSFSLATTGLPASLPFVTDLAVVPSNFNVAYATLSGFGTSHVFRTINAGQSWQDISGNLPDTPANAVAVDPGAPLSHIFVGTDVGVFETTNAGLSWGPLQRGLPNVSVFMLRLKPTTGALIAATHGRGVFELLNAVSLIP